MEKYCISLDQAKRLVELGFVKSSDNYWLEVNSLEDGIKTYFNKLPSFLDHRPCRGYPAYHVGELGEILDESIENVIKIDRGWLINPQDYKYAFPTEAQARGALLIYLLENKLI